MINIGIIIVCTFTFYSHIKTITPQEIEQFEAIAQEHCYQSYDLFMRSQHDESRLLSPDQKNRIALIKKCFNEHIPAIRDILYNSENPEQSIVNFGNYLIQLSKLLELDEYSVFRQELPTQMKRTLSTEQKIAYVDFLSNKITHYYQTIKPLGVWHKRLEHALLYNFVSTYIAPPFIKSFGIYCSWQLMGWAIQKKIDQFATAMRAQRTRMRIPTDQWEYLAFEADNFIKAITTFNVQSIGSTFLKSSFLASPASALWMFANWFHEYQLPEYEYRIRKAQEDAEQKKIDQEMRNRKINYEDKIGFDLIKGHQELIAADIALIVDYLKHPFRYHAGSGSYSILFYGNPGNGKTLLARSIAKESGAPYLEITADDIINEQAKEKIIATWKLAQKTAALRKEKSAIIYIDEIDCVVGNRQQGMVDIERAKALANLLSVLDGIEDRNPFLHIVIIITTNHHENLDPALMRPGRVDRKILVAPPSAAGREEFFSDLLPSSNKEFMPTLITMTNNFSGAQIVNLVNTAQMYASFNRHSIPTWNDYLIAYAHLSNTEYISATTEA